ncbi:hypothetical protein [Brevundimonas sp.]|uniref:hypothetical protein n=1 Tax=Brevundimonas sp. TaxID=1871086 RepID=UPI002CCCC5FD|nr:hypothetical protein [Brevundimonas sp.]HWQ86933.1 hypothetical protein [Brevundimonas sp.]
MTRLLMAETEDPRASSGLRFKPPAPSVTPDVMAFMEGLGLSSVDVLLRPWPQGSAGFGADRAGVHRISVADPGDPACAAYARYLVTPRADGKPIFPYTSPDHCIAVTFVSDAPDMAAYSHVAVSYVDASTRGWFRYVEELRDRSSRVFARSVTYGFNAPLSPECPGGLPHQRLADIMRP